MLYATIQRGCTTVHADRDILEMDSHAEILMNATKEHRTAVSKHFATILRDHTTVNVHHGQDTKTMERIALKLSQTFRNCMKGAEQRMGRLYYSSTQSQFQFSVTWEVLVVGMAGGRRL
ncbi:uncharacterized protein LOC111341104 [Stylophora pistillata]|uniref:uncharacterized protein LOC111341104 n=1 Tax=Stylophora pistillata TaxID=50429 RepID=UPI000C051B18|nr:uncharacterized protein LOC111341104 [Stylophora pistillata]